MAKKLLEQVKDKIRLKQYSINTEKTYVHWIYRYIIFHNKKHPKDMGKAEIEAFLTALAKQNVAATTQNQAFNAILFLYNEVLDISMKDANIQALRAKQRERIPVVLSRKEVQQILEQITNPTHRLCISLLYGCGLRLQELLTLRVLHLDFAYENIRIMDSKNIDDRLVPMPQKIMTKLEEQIELVRDIHSQDLKDGYGSVYLPNALAKKFKKADKELKWQFLFPSKTISKDPKTGIERRHHFYPTNVSKAIASATKKAGILKKVTAHTFRHSYATHLLQSGLDIRTIQELLGHKDVSTTMIYTHIVKSLNEARVMSPLDFD